MLKRVRLGFTSGPHSAPQKRKILQCSFPAACSPPWSANPPGRIRQPFPKFPACDPEERLSAATTRLRQGVGIETIAGAEENPLFAVKQVRNLAV